MHSMSQIILRWSSFGDQERYVLKVNLAVVLGLNMFISFVTPSIDTAAHIGGLILGTFGALSILTVPDVDHFGIHKYKTHATAVFLLLSVLGLLLLWIVPMNDATICI